MQMLTILRGEIDSQYLDMMFGGMPQKTIQKVMQYLSVVEARLQHATRCERVGALFREDTKGL